MAKRWNGKKFSHTKVAKPKAAKAKREPRKAKA
jgi:hypothetical protein